MQRYAGTGDCYYSCQSPFVFTPVLQQGRVGKSICQQRCRLCPLLRNPHAEHRPVQHSGQETDVPGGNNAPESLFWQLKPHGDYVYIMTHSAFQQFLWSVKLFIVKYRLKVLTVNIVYVFFCIPVHQEFIHNQRKINNGEDFPRQFLTDIFNRIRLANCPLSILWSL